MSLYECVFIARQDISATQVEGLVGQFTGIIEDNGGKVASSEMWGAPIGPPNAESWPKPRSSNMITTTFGAVRGGRTASGQSGVESR